MALYGLLFGVESFLSFPRLRLTPCRVAAGKSRPTSSPTPRRRRRSRKTRRRPTRIWQQPRRRRTTIVGRSVQLLAALRRSPEEWRSAKHRECRYRSGLSALEALGVGGLSVLQIR